MINRIAGRSAAVVVIALGLLGLDGIEAAAAVSPAPGAGDTAPVVTDSWGPLRLGMRQEQVRELRLFTWTQHTATVNTYGLPITSFEARDPVQLYGLPAKLLISFKMDVALAITLERRLGKRAASGQCERAFLGLMRGAEAAYGALSPTDSPEPRHLIEAAYVTVSPESVPGAASSFSRTTVDYRSAGIDPGFPADLVVELRAERREEPNVIRVETGWSVTNGVESCDSAELSIVSLQPG